MAGQEGEVVRVRARRGVPRRLWSYSGSQPKQYTLYARPMTG